MKNVIAIAAIGLTTSFAAAQTLPVPAVPQTGNLLQNGNFESGSGSITSGYQDAVFSALEHWGQWANTGPVTSEWSGGSALDGSHAAHMQTQSYDGLVQFFSGDAGSYTLAGWFKVTSGSARLGLAWNGGNDVLYSAPISAAADWQYLSITLNSPSADKFAAVVYGATNGSDFYADGLWLNAGSTSNSPYSPDSGFSPSPVPEPAIASTFMLGLAALALMTRRRSRKV